MTLVKFSNFALQDLRSIEEYYSGISAHTCQNVTSDIADSLEQLEHQPESGVAFRDNQRRIITQKYRFVIIYINAQSYAEIIGIYRFQNR